MSDSELMQLIDTHCHLDLEIFEPDREQVLARAASAGIAGIVVPAIDASSWENLRRITEPQAVLHAAYGLHPMFMHRHSLTHIEALDQWLKQHPAIAVGECGLDFYIDHPDRQGQVELFEAQLGLAAHHRLPVIIHARKAVEEVMLCLKKFPGLRGVLHSYSGSLQQAEQLIDMGFYLGFGGPVTYSRATRLHKLVSELPLEGLLLETDAPDQPDSRHHGQRNEPGYLGQVLGRIAQLRGTSEEALAEATTANAKTLFGLDPVTACSTA